MLMSNFRDIVDSQKYIYTIKIKLLKKILIILMIFYHNILLL